MLGAIIGDDPQEIIIEFVSKLVDESNEMDPEIASIVNEDYRELPW